MVFVQDNFILPSHISIKEMKYLLFFFGCIYTYINQAQPSIEVEFNSKKLSPIEIREIQKLYGVAPLPGRYWYDARSGMYGINGGPAAGVMYPGHSFGKLASDASNGNSGVFINNRQLQALEAVQLANIFGYRHPIPGRYWMNPNGDLGVEGHDYAIGNVYMAVALAQHHQVNQSTHSGNLWSGGLYSGGNFYTGANGQPSQGYVSVPGYGPVSHGMN